MSKHPAPLRVRNRLRLVPRTYVPRAGAAPGAGAGPVPGAGAGVVPAAVNRYLLPGEGWRNGVTTVRQHPVMLAPASASVVGVLLAGIIAGRTSHGNPALILVVWIIFAFLLLRLVMVVTNWSAQYIAITETTFLLTSGLMTRTIISIPLTDLSGMTLERSTAGRLMGYGAFRIGSDSLGQLIINYVPYPEGLYLNIKNLIHTTEEEAANS